MKLKILFTVALFFAISCDVNQINQKEELIEDLSLIELRDRLKNITDYQNLMTGDSQYLKMISENDELESILSPLLEVGNSYLEEIKQNEKHKRNSSLLDYSDDEIMLIGIISLFQNELKSNSEMSKKKDIDYQRAYHCLSSALGLDLAQNIISGTVDLMDAKTLKKVVKTMGKRYLGYVGLAIAVYEFSMCVS